MAQYIPVPAPPVPGPLLPALMYPIPVPVHAPDLPVPVSLSPALMDVVPVLGLPPPPMLPVAFLAPVPLAPAIPLPASAIAPQLPLPLARQPFNPNWPVHYMGKMDVPCPDCGALHWHCEKLPKSSQANPKFGMCCFSGKIKLPKLDNPPPELLNLLSGQDPP